MAEVQILGSAAAEGIPAIFCTCDVCKKAWANGGKDVRMRAAYKLSDTVRIDFGPDTLAQEYKFQLHSEKLKHLFITHSHEDHLYLDNFIYRMKGFSSVDQNNILNVYGNPGVIHAIQKFFWGKSYHYFDGNYDKFKLNLVPLKPFEPVILEEEDMEIYPLKADHMINIASEIPMFYVFRNGSSWGMIANDTGYFRDETWEFLESKKFKFDLVITDCTGCLLDIERGHMSGKYVVDTKKRLEEIGSVTSNTQYYINHFSHNGKANHVDLEARFNPEGIQVGYDGLVIKY
jgi:phosphoribosyl 1,2-cyclic phosphate phosphodiesterase